MTAIDFKFKDLLPVNRVFTTAASILASPNALVLTEGAVAFTGDDRITALAPGFTVDTNPDVYMILAGPNAQSINQAPTDGSGDFALIRRRLAGRDLKVVSTVKYSPGNLSAILFTGMNTPQASTTYSFSVRLAGYRSNRRTNCTDLPFFSSAITTPDFAAQGILDPLDWFLQNMVDVVNTNSYLHSPKEDNAFVAFALAASGGTAINTLKEGDLVDLGGGKSIKMTMPLIATLTEAITNDATLGAKNIIPVDLTTAGTAPTVTEVLFLSLPEKRASVYDDIYYDHPDLQVSVSHTDATNYTKLASARPAVGQGGSLAWEEKYEGSLRRRHKAVSFTTPHLETSAKPLVDPEKIYNVTRIYFEGKRPDTPHEGYGPRAHEVVILLEAQVDNPTATAGTPYTVSTVDPGSLVADLNATLGAWLLSAPNVELHGEANTTQVFV
ncbi:MAG: hypothetical protein D6746_16680 [Bacteroidetes bacterium]|nr:MAG: hypothetical protein D6746_16680 [Bacteroidota bacterium]